MLRFLRGKGQRGGATSAHRCIPRCLGIPEQSRDDMVASTYEPLESPLARTSDWMLNQLPQNAVWFDVPDAGVSFAESPFG